MKNRQQAQENETTVFDSAPPLQRALLRYGGRGGCLPVWRQKAQKENRQQGKCCQRQHKTEKAGGMEAVVMV